MITAARLARDPDDPWDRYKLADRMGVSYATISRWETNKARPGRESANKLTKVLGIPAEELWEAIGADLVVSPEGRVAAEVIEYFSRFDPEAQKAIVRHLQLAGEMVAASR